MLLENVRVLDFTQYLSGPSATRMLAELGADVIKVEYGPGGDPSRTLPFVSGEGSSSYYTQQNRGKRSMCLDQVPRMVADSLGNSPLIVIWSSKTLAPAF